MWGGLLGRVPLTFDESYNYEVITRNGFGYVVTNFVAMNNHRLFSILQTSLPTSWIEREPSALRSINLLVAFALAMTVRRILLRAGFEPPWSNLWMAAVLLSSPIFTLYLFIARGYLLGSTLLLLAAEQAAAGTGIGLLAMGAISGLAAASVPTFALAFPGLLLGSWPRLWRALGTRRALIFSAASCGLNLAAALALYAPVLGQLRHEATILRPGTNTLTFLSQGVPMGNSLLLSALIAAAVLFAVCNVWRARHPFEEMPAAGFRRGLATSLLAASISYVVIFTVAITLHLCVSPFPRNGLFTAPFLLLSLALLSADLPTPRRWILVGAAGANLACGALLAIRLLSGGDPNDYPGARELIPTAAANAVALAASVGPLDKLETTPFWGETPAQPYAEELHVPQVPLGETAGMECTVGTHRPPRGQEVVAVRQGRRYLVCF